MTNAPLGRTLVPLVVAVAAVLATAALADRINASTDPGSEASTAPAERPEAESSEAETSDSTERNPDSGAVPAPAPPQSPSEGADASRPPLGPGAVLEFDAETAPLIPSGVTTDEYVTRYYEALKAGDLATAFRLVPRADPGQTVEDFAALLVGYEVADYAIFQSAESSETGETLVFIFTPNDGAWNTAWEFAETAKGLVVKDLTYSRPGGTACH